MKFADIACESRVADRNYRKLVLPMPANWQYGHALIALWRDLLLSIPDESAALVIGHSGDIEIGLLACFPQADHRRWGGPLDVCEGARLGFTDHFTTLDLLRGETPA